MWGGRRVDEDYMGYHSLSSSTFKIFSDGDRPTIFLHINKTMLWVLPSAKLFFLIKRLKCDSCGLSLRLPRLGLFIFIVPPP